VFNPASANTVTIPFTSASVRYLRLNVTANTAWPAAQVSEFEVYGPDTGDVQAPAAPSNLTFTEPGSGQIRLTWNAATDNVAVTGYDVFANGVLRASVSANVLTYTDTQPAGTNIAYFMQAKDAAGNQSGNSNTATRFGTTVGANLAVGKAITASSSVFTFVATNANDNNTATYWEGAGGSYPNLLTVALGSNADLNQVVLKLNPDSAWGPRTQTIEVQGRDQASQTYTTLVPATAYNFAPASGNTVTIR
jgi:hypothetical protein